MPPMSMSSSSLSSSPLTETIAFGAGKRPCRALWPAQGARRYSPPRIAPITWRRIGADEHRRDRWPPYPRTACAVSITHRALTMRAGRAGVTDLAGAPAYGLVCALRRHQARIAHVVACHIESRFDNIFLGDVLRKGEPLRAKQRLD
jgi:hypothetical protein